MKIRLRQIFCIVAVIALTASCQEEKSNLPTAKERSDEAVNDLVDQLTAPEHGWVLNYEPNPGAGTYYILLDFGTDGLVRIQSDVPDDNGNYYDHSLPYRIDVRLNLQLILETYGVFHFLFEQYQNGFGAEFEFIYDGEENDNLKFISKSDNPSNQTVLTFIPATANSANTFSREIPKNLQTYTPFSPQFLGASPAQHISLPGENISLFWNIDLLSRNLIITGAGMGTTVPEVITNNEITILDHSSPYSVTNGKLALYEPVTFSVASVDYTFSEISLSTFTEDGAIMCNTGNDQSPVYSGNAMGLGSATMYKTLFDPHGTAFQPMAEQAYSVNVLYVLTPEGRSLSTNGSIYEHFPSARWFVFNYGLEDDNQPMYAAGLIAEDSNGIPQEYLREFEPTVTNGNSVQISLNDNFYFSGVPDPDDESNLRAITDEIFGDGEIFASVVPADDLVIFRLYNPCNGYEFYLVQ